MIKIGRPEKDYYTCQSCNSNYSVNKITIGLHESSTSSFRICDHCLMKMGDIKVLEVMELNKKLQEQNKILREALEFYANGIVQKDDYSEHKSISTFSFTGLNRKNSGYGETEFVEQRFGKRAREALAKVGE